MGIASNLASLSLLITHFPVVASFQASNQAIIVRCTLLNPEQARQRAVDFVRSTGVANGQKQVARWVVPVCIKVIGVSAAHSAKVKNLMLGVAREANVPVAKQDCKPNLTVSFAADAGLVARHIPRKKPHQFRELAQTERDQLLAGNAPVRWWYATQMLDRDGMKENNISPPWATAGEETRGTSPITVGGIGEMSSTQQYNSGSHVRTPTVRSLYGATVIVDVTRATGTRLNAISAYAAMVAFAEVDADAPPPDSILGLFQPELVETSLTDWDMAFLKSLYRMPLDRRSRIQRGHLIEALLDERLPALGEAKKP